MDNIRASYSRIKKKIKHRLTGDKHKRDGAGSDASGGRVDSSGSLPQPEPPIAAGGGGDRDGNGTNADGGQDFSTGGAPQPELGLTGHNDNDRQRREADVDEREASQGYSRLEPDVETVEGSRRSGEVEEAYPSPSTPAIPHSGNPDGM